jgi:hypothetical protein
MWSQEFNDMLILLVMAALLRASYELSRQPASGISLNPSTEDAGLMPWQQEASERAVKKYAEAQKRKWRRWNEAMFERVG